MTRKKVKLTYIQNEPSRKATFKKRKKGLMKKVNELSTLCGITASAIIYSPYDSNPEVWPSNSGVQRVISEFRALPEMDQHKKMVDQESFLRQRIAKASENLKRQRKENRELEMTQVMFQCLLGNMGMFHMNIMDLNDLGYLIDQYLKDINRRIEILGNSGMEIGESSNAVTIPSEGVETMTVVAATTAPLATTIDMGASSSSLVTTGFINHIQQHPHQQHPRQQHHFRHPTTPSVGFYEHPRHLNLNQNQNQQQWFMEMMNHPEQMSYAADQMGFPFMDDNNRNHHNHHQPQSRLFLGESSNVPAIASSSSTTPTTDPNLINNLWFH